MWNLRDVFMGIERGTLSMARVCIGVGLCALVLICVERDLFAVIAAAATVTAVVSVAIGLIACKIGEWLDDVCMELELGDPIETVDLKDWADAQMTKWSWWSTATLVVAVVSAQFSPWALLILVVPAFWLIGIKLVKRSANVKIRELGTDEVEIEHWRPTFERVKALKA